MRATNGPRAERGTQKYGPENGLFSEETFQGLDLPRNIIETLTAAGNSSLAKSTWGVYKTAVGHIEKCSMDTGIALTFPMDKKGVLIYVGWLLGTRGVKGSTVESYLSGLRMAHLSKGFDIPCLRPDVIKSILGGAKNLSAIEDRAGNKPMRLPVTLDMLKLLKHELNDLEETTHFKRMTWAIACIMFFGAFRVHEILSRKPDSYDPDFTCLQGDIVLHKAAGIRTLQILLKSPKENRVGNKVIVDVYENGSGCCPIQAFEKLQARGSMSKRGEPAFMLESGKAYTGALLNSTLKKCLGKYIAPEKGHISSHSFRSGLASMLGSLGFSDEDVKAIGRWSSSAFETYMRLPRTKRAAMARRIAGLDL